MTLGELKKKLEERGIRQVGSLGKRTTGEERASYTLVFSSDDKVVFPFPFTAYFLTLDSTDDSTHVNSEKVKALLRAIRRDKGSSESDPTWLIL